MLYQGWFEDFEILTVTTTPPINVKRCPSSSIALSTALFPIDV
jgi:hypothetical protein